MAKNYVKPKTAEAAARVKEHQFGQPNGNRRGDPSAATAQREFYRWVMTKATEEELNAYLRDKSNPMFRRSFIRTWLKSDQVGDYIMVTNQIYGMPRQEVEVQSLPQLNCNVFGVDDEQKPE